MIVIHSELGCLDVIQDDVFDNRHGSLDDLSEQLSIPDKVTLGSVGYSLWPRDPGLLNCEDRLHQRFTLGHF